MRICRRILLPLLLLAAILTTFTSAAGDVTLSFEGEDVQLAGMVAYRDPSSGTVMARIDFFTDPLGAEVAFDEKSGSIQIATAENILNFNVDETSAKLNNRSVSLEVAPTVKDGEAYVPLRFSAEGLGFQLAWDEKENRVNVSPLNAFELGITRDEMIRRYGQPEEALSSEKGYVWQVYRREYSDYRLIGLDGDTVEAYYVNGGNWSLPFGPQAGMKQSSCQRIMNSLGYQSVSGSGCTTYLSAYDALTVYYPEYGEREIYAALYETASYASVCVVTPDVLTAQEQLLFDLTNIARVKNGLAPFDKQSTVQLVAKEHASEMAKGDFFSHQDENGLNAKGRLEAAGLEDFYVSEAMSKAYPNSFAAFASFYSNLTYNEILTARFQTVSVGYSYNPDSEGVLYCVQLFYAEKD